MLGWGRKAGEAHLCRISSGKRVLSSSSTRVGRARKYTAPPSVPRQATALADVGRTTVTRVMPGEQLEGRAGRGAASVLRWGPDLPHPDDASPSSPAREDGDRDSLSANSN